MRWFVESMSKFVWECDMHKRAGWIGPCAEPVVNARDISGFGVSSVFMSVFPFFVHVNIEMSQYFAFEIIRDEILLYLGLMSRPRVEWGFMTATLVIEVLRM